MKILIVVCSGTRNRGTEALVRGISKIVSDNFDGCEISLASSMPHIDKLSKLPNVKNYINRTYFPPKYSIAHFKSYFWRKIGNYVRSDPFFALCSSQDLILIVGADNFDIEYGSNEGLYKFNHTIRKVTKGKLVLYDCSFNKNAITSDLLEHLTIYDAVTVREIQTIANLMEYNCNKELYEHFPDPAFVMEPEPISLPDGWKTGDMVGINLSNLVMRDCYGTNVKQNVFTAYNFLLESIISNTEFDIVLVPHVMNGADLGVLKILYEKFKHTGRLLLIDDENLSAPQLKYILSQCRFFIGARTHATIAAYSSCVPTLVLGYSVKSIGIAQDLFGSEIGKVVSIHNVDHANTLWDAFNEIVSHENEIRDHLCKIMPEYKKRAEDVGKYLKSLFV